MKQRSLITVLVVTHFVVDGRQRYGSLQQNWVQMEAWLGFLRLQYEAGHGQGTLRNARAFLVEARHRV